MVDSTYKPDFSVASLKVMLVSISGTLFKFWKCSASFALYSSNMAVEKLKTRFSPFSALVIK